LKILCLAFTTLDSYPHHITEPLYSGDEIIRDSNLVVYVNDSKTGYYIGYIKGLNHLDLNGENKFRLVVRRVIPNEYSKGFVGRVYLEERLEQGDEFLFHAEDLSRDKSKLYGRFLSYNVFCFRDFKRKEIKLGSYLRVKSRLVRESHIDTKVEPIRFSSIEEFERERNRIFRAGS